MVIPTWSAAQIAETARSQGDAPDIDGKIFFSSAKPLKMGEFIDVLVEDVLDYDLIGRVVD